MSGRVQPRSRPSLDKLRKAREAERDATMRVDAELADAQRYYSLRELAAIAGCSKDTVHTRITRYRERQQALDLTT